eukprot:4273973-Pleurochrysis_carterae.AAC.1
MQSHNLVDRKCDSAGMGRAYASGYPPLPERLGRGLPDQHPHRPVDLLRHLRRNLAHIASLVRR